ncbi:hypothetical protein PLESTF_001567100 [Pleodorina starrii]|nr:hypothetical protein PLESTF_001567100 [Pleodorina starrii]
MGWSRTALHDRLAKQLQVEDYNTVTVISRHHDPVHGPDVSALSSHCYGSQGATAAAGASGPSGPPSSPGSGTPGPPLNLRLGDQLALPIACNGRLVAALILGWGTEAGGAGGGGDRAYRHSGAGAGGGGGTIKSAPLAAAYNHNQHLSNQQQHIGQQQQQPRQKQGADVAMSGAAAAVAAAAAAGGGGSLTLGAADLRELRRLAQFLGYGLFSDPQQGVYLEQVAALLCDIAHGAFSGLHDVVAAVLEALPCLLQTKLSLPLQPLLAAVLGNSVPAVVFARRHGAGGQGGLLQSTISVCSTAGGGTVHGSRGGGGGTAIAGSGGAALKLAHGGGGASGYGSLVMAGGGGGGESRSGSRKYLERDMSLHSLAVGTPGGLRSGDLLGCDVMGSGVIGHGGGTDGGGGDGVSRVKAVRTALAYTLLQRVLRVGSYSVCGAEEPPDVPPHGPAITPLVISNASSQVLEEEQPGRDVLLAANLTGAGVAGLVLCAEAPTQQNNQNHIGGGGGGAWSPQGPMWASASAAVAATPLTPGPESNWGAFGSGNGGGSRLSRCGVAAAAAAAAAAADVHDAGEGGGGRGVGLAAAAGMVPLLPGGVATPTALSYVGGASMVQSMPSLGCGGGGGGGGTLPFRLALYLVSSDPAPAGVLEAVAEEMKGLLPLIFGAMHAAIAAGGAATGDFCVLQAQVLQRATTSGTLEIPTPQATPATERRGPPPLSHLSLQSHPHPHPPALSPQSSNLRSPGAAAAAASATLKSPRTGATPSPPGARRGSIGGFGSSSRLRLASQGPPPAPGGGAAAGGAGGAGTADSNEGLSVSSSASSNGRPDGGGRAGARGDGRGDAAAGGGGGGARAREAARGRLLLQNNTDDLVIPAGHYRELDMESSAPHLQRGVGSALRKISAPCYVLSSPVLQLEEVAGPRPLELLVTSARTRITAVAAGSDAGEEARLAVVQDLAAVDLQEVIGSGGQGVVFRGTLHGLETAVKVWEHNGRAPLEHDGEWLSAEAEGAGQPNVAEGQQQQQQPGGGGGNGNGNGNGNGGAEAVASSRDCIRQAKRGAMEVAVTVTLSHPNVVQPYAHFSDVVVVERQPAAPAPPGSGPSPGPLQLRLCAHDDPVFRGQKAGPLNTVLCLEYCDAGTLLSAARRGDFRLPDSGPRDGPVWPSMVPLYTSLLEVALALRYLHARRLVHCDLKPGNVLLKTSTRDPRGWTCKLSDFGCVRLMDEFSPDGAPGFRMAQVFGTVAYMSPECFSRGRLLGTGVDVYAFGVLMWELMHCKPPHAGIDPKELPRLVARSNVRPDFHPLAPHDYRSLACSCWSASPERRPSATQLVSQLQQLLGAAKAAATATAAQQQQNGRQAALQPRQSLQLMPTHQQQQQGHLAPQQPQQQQQQQQSPHPSALQQKRQLMRFPSAQSEGRLCDRVVREQAHQAMAQQAMSLLGGAGGGAGGGGGGGDAPRQHQQHQQRLLSRNGSVGACRAEAGLAPLCETDSAARDSDRHWALRQPQPLLHPHNNQHQHQHQQSPLMQQRPQRGSAPGMHPASGAAAAAAGGRAATARSPLQVSPGMLGTVQPTVGL